MHAVGQFDQVGASSSDPNRAAFGSLAADDEDMRILGFSVHGLCRHHDAVIDDAAAFVTVSKDNRTVASLSGRDIDLNRSQGEIGLFVPDAGYPFGEIPDWLIRQRSAVPDWAPSRIKRLRQYEQK